MIILLFSSIIYDQSVLHRLVMTNMISLPEIKTADSAHRGNNASVTRPFSGISEGNEAH